MEGASARERLSSRLGFILLSAGCAIGIGNVWRFPYVVGQSGGGWFIPLYLLALAALGVPVLVMEFAVGRAAQRSLARAHAVLTPRRPGWRVHGALGLAGTVLLMMFYTTVAGWMLIYFRKTAAGAFAGLSPEGIGAAFGAVLADPALQAKHTVGVCVGCAAICAFGVQKGLERVTKGMMLALLGLIAALAVHSVCLDGAGRGVSFYLLPDLARFMEAGPANVAVDAITQAFFTLSLGIGSMAIFGSYIGKDRALLGEAVHVALLDTVVAFTAGLVIIPACFAYGVEPGQGPGLVFVTLPNVFNHMAGGRVWGALFFLLMSFAALSTVLAVFEAIIASLVDYLKWPRRAVCAAVAVGISALSLPCILGFNLLGWLHPLGGESTVLDLEDFLVSDLLLPVGAMLFARYCTSRYGWGWRNFRVEANAGEGPKVPRGLRIYCGYVIPLVIGGILVLAVIRRFG